MAKKVGGPVKAAGSPEKEKKVKHEYLVPTGGIKLADGATTGTPTDFDPKVHKPLKKKDFATQGGFMMYRADVYDRAAARYGKAASRLRDQAKISGQYSPEQEKFAKKAKRASEQFAEMIKQLKAQGIDPNTIPGLSIPAELQSVA